ncbi:uncharacterized protein J8A68_005939 [[Candida] subhashii]|uniref:Uncharacterized protein n=1 Tax=[Candida] subhashii TaxID=561895 RepID=A0A8J5QL56_9ASCO|nr:uncharacterized protein J8A68_005939 [[Candida] subhashii]KAG7660520.1 hypothetical protein J8A68_005939 [[Candida] subhashii]
MNTSRTGSEEFQDSGHALKEPIHFEDLPLDIIDEIIYWLTEGEVNLHSSNKTVNDKNIPNYSFCLNKIRCQGFHFELISLSSTCSFFRQRLGPVIFRNLSLVRENQIDSALSSPKNRELYSDKKTYIRQFFRELLEVNAINCSTTDLARNSFKEYIRGDKQFKSRFESQFAINNFVTYLECDNSTLKYETLSLFPQLEALKVLDEASVELNLGEVNLPRLEYLAINARTLTNTPGILGSLKRIKRLDLLLDYSEFRNQEAIRSIMNQLERGNILQELVLFLNSEFGIYNADTIGLLASVVDNGNVKRITIRSKRRKFYGDPRDNQRPWPLYKGFVGDRILQLIRGVEEVILDMCVLGALRFHPDTYSIEAPSVNRDSLMEKKLTLVDPVSSIQFPSNVKENILILMHNCLFTEFNFQYGESLADEHHRVLRLVTDFVYKMSSSYDDTPYSGLRQLSIEKCWSLADDSIKREYIGNLIKDSKESKNLTKRTMQQLRLDDIAVWNKTPFNSPSYRVRDTYDIVYQDLEARINEPVQVITFISRDERSINRSFWSVETSLVDFEQYSTHQRKSFLWD